MCYLLIIIKNPNNPGIMAFTTCESNETVIANVGDIFIKLKRYMTIASPEPKPFKDNGKRNARFIRGATARI